ncbi:MAG: right-handed parallel beta-helix repeat-containing protein [Phycisphaerales bacterium]
MHHRTTSVRACLAFLAAAAASGWVQAGPITPPAGPVSSTYKTLNEVQPRTAIGAATTPGDADSVCKITQPGSYYLTGNLQGVAGKHGIEITCSAVTIDLSGFTVAGVASSLDGISVTQAGQRGIAVRNGNITGFGGDGVDTRANSASDCRFENLTAADNGGAGISVKDGSVVSGCIATGNAGRGMYAGARSVVSGCQANANSSVGIQVDLGCTLTGCVASNNATGGIVTFSGCTLTDCVASTNTLKGISTQAMCTLRGCVATANDTGVLGVGIDVGDYGTATGCTASAGSGRGIGASTGASILSCVTQGNAREGIYVVDSCLVRGNTCTNNGTDPNIGANIYAHAGHNRIEENNCTGAHRGIEVHGAGNFIIRNTVVSAGQTVAYDIAAGNVHGNIMDRTNNGAPAVIGTTGAGTLGTTDFNANFSY